MATLTLWIHDSTVSSRDAILNLDLVQDSKVGSIVEIVVATDKTKKFLFVARAVEPEIKKKQPNLQLSISDQVAASFGFQSRSTVHATIVSPYFL